MDKWTGFVLEKLGIRNKHLEYSIDESYQQNCSIVIMGIKKRLKSRPLFSNYLNSQRCFWPICCMKIFWIWSSYVFKKSDKFHNSPYSIPKCHSLSCIYFTFEHLIFEEIFSMQFFPFKIGLLYSNSEVCLGPILLFQFVTCTSHFTSGGMHRGRWCRSPFCTHRYASHKWRARAARAHPKSSGAICSHSHAAHARLTKIERESRPRETAQRMATLSFSVCVCVTWQKVVPPTRLRPLKMYTLVKNERLLCVFALTARSFRNAFLHIPHCSDPLWLLHVIRRKLARTFGSLWANWIWKFN